LILGAAYQVTTSRTKINRGLSKESVQKIGTPTYFCKRWF